MIVLAHNRLFFLLLLAPLLHAADLVPTNLRTEHLEDPLAIGTTWPRLSWQLQAADPAACDLKQSAYEIRVASSAEKLSKPDLWNSGKVNGRTASLVRYEGKTLKSRAHCFWQVRVWDQDGEVSDWSKPAEFGIGLLEPGDWTAQWIAARKRRSLNR